MSPGLKSIVLCQNLHLYRGCFNEIFILKEQDYGALEYMRISQLLGHKTLRCPAQRQNLTLRCATGYFQPFLPVGVFLLYGVSFPLCTDNPTTLPIAVCMNRYSWPRNAEIVVSLLDDRGDDPRSPSTTLLGGFF